MNKTYMPLYISVWALRTMSILFEVALGLSAFSGIHTFFSFWYGVLFVAVFVLFCELGKGYLCSLIYHEYKGGSSLWVYLLSFLLGCLFLISLAINVCGVSHYQTTTRQADLSLATMQRQADATRATRATIAELKESRANSFSVYASRKTTATLDSTIAGLQLLVSEKERSISQDMERSFVSENRNRRFLGLLVVPFSVFFMLLLVAVRNKREVPVSSESEKIYSLLQDIQLSMVRQDSDTVRQGCDNGATPCDMVRQDSDMLVSCSEYPPQQAISRVARVLELQRLGYTWKQVLNVISSEEGASVSIKTLQRQLKKYEQEHKGQNDNRF